MNKRKEAKEDKLVYKRRKEGVRKKGKKGKRSRRKR